MENLEIQKRRKGSFTAENVNYSIIEANDKIREILKMIPNGVIFIVCFTSSLVLRACDESAKYHDESLKFLFWRYGSTGKITRDCDLIFENNPSDEIQASIRKWNRCNDFDIDWWEETHYQGPWEWVKNHGIKHREFIDGIPVQPFEDLIWTKKNLLRCDPKHANDAANLPAEFTFKN